MKKKITILIVAVAVTLTAISHHLLDSVSDKYYQSEAIGSGLGTDIAFWYANVLIAFGLVPDHKTIAVAASYARNLRGDLESNTERAGRAVRMLLSVANKKEGAHATQAAYEALVLLVRMPSDSRTALHVNDLAQRLAVALTAQAGNATPMEKFQIPEVLTMVAARSRADGPMQVRASINPPADANDAQWLAKLAAVRIGFSVCAQSSVDFPTGLHSALNAAFPSAWLKNEARLGWDAPFIDLIIQTSRSPTCVEQARNFKSQIAD